MGRWIPLLVGLLFVVAVAVRSRRRRRWGSLVWLLWYSYVEWRTDPDRVPVTGTRPASAI